MKKSSVLKYSSSFFWRNKDFNFPRFSTVNYSKQSMRSLPTNAMKIEKLITQPSVLIQECCHKNLTFPVFWRVMVTVATSVDHELYS